MIIYRTIYLLMPAAVVLAFLWAPTADILGEATRILYFHVPVAWVSVLAFLVAGIFSLILIVDKRGRFPGLGEKAHHSASLGLVFNLLAVISGSIWAKISWGSYWNWDPRETSIIFLLLIYMAYMSLHNALRKNPNRQKIRSAYLIIASAVMPFFIFIVPRMFPSLHPAPVINAERTVSMNGAMQLTLLVSLAAFTLLFFYLFALLNKIDMLENLTGDHREDH